MKRCALLLALVPFAVQPDLVIWINGLVVHDGTVLENQSQASAVNAGFDVGVGLLNNEDFLWTPPSGSGYPSLEETLQGGFEGVQVGLTYSDQLPNDIGALSDGNTLLFDKEYLETASPAELFSTIWHESIHIIPGDEFSGFQVSASGHADIVVQQFHMLCSMRDAGVEVPDGAFERLKGSFESFAEKAEEAGEPAPETQIPESC